jgi:hypothetical protein
MANKPTPSQLRDAADISLPYASQILSGDRAPSRSLAIRLMRKLDWRHSILDGLSEEQIDVLETVDPWIPTKERAA